jgi:hypothetical protein
MTARNTCTARIFWTDLHKRLSIELGLPSLSPLAYSYNTDWMGKSQTVTGTWTMDKVCENWVLRDFDGSEAADSFIKERLSLVEIGFRKRGEDIAAENASLPQQIAENRLRAARKGAGIRLPGDPAAWLITKNEQTNKIFHAAVEELNTRFTHAHCDLNYHNGFIQRSTDALSVREVEAPFWALVADPPWKNVDLDMKEALDQRDAGARDPAFYAGRALESTIKIISDSNGWTHGKEKGAHNFIDNLASHKAGFITSWEGEIIKLFFSKVRNPMGHGPGSNEMIALTEHQTNWAIEFCMTWIKSLIRRQ